MDEARGASARAVSMRPNRTDRGVMKEDFDNGNVVMVAAIIWGAVFSLGLLGAFAKFL